MTPYPSFSLPLSASPTSLKGVGPVKHSLLKRLGIESVGDLLTHYPRAYQDRRLASLAAVSPGDKVVVAGLIEGLRLKRLHGRKTILEAILDDGTGRITLVWFNQPYIANKLRIGERVRAFGKVTRRRGLLIASPELQPADAEPTEGLLPLYPATQGITQTFFRKTVPQVLELFSNSVEDPLPERLRAKFSLLPLREALRYIHFPPDHAALSAAKKRLAFQEALIFQLGLAVQKAARTQAPAAQSFSINDKVNRRIAARIPFTLTRGQRRALAEIQQDIARTKPMSRLLQGDVGSGKTIVALWAMLTSVANRAQAALMAPTELLALQHYRQMAHLLKGSTVRTLLCVGSIPSEEKRLVRQRIASGSADIVVGTHALLQEQTSFKRLGLIVIDEQHRFGVLQRARLSQKAASPHVLVMSATPIPRTLALTLFSDLDISTIDDLPPGRIPIDTAIVKRAELEPCLEFLAGLIRRGERGFYVCPAVSSTSREVTVRRIHRDLQQGPLNGVKIAVLHARLPWDQRAAALEAFRQGSVPLLLCSTVAEVGIDVPEATFIAIDDARSFGLAQLHQLRGRVGRGSRRAYCFLIDRGGEPTGLKRLQLLAKLHDGFRISEADLSMRGPGEFFGLRQSGVLRFKMVNLSHDADLLRSARKEAVRILEHDPLLSRPEHRGLKTLIGHSFGPRLPLAGVA